MDSSSPDYRKIIFGGLWLDTEKMTKQVLVGFNAKESFTKMNKYGNMIYGIGVKMMKFKPINVKQPVEEIRGGEGESPLVKVGKHDNLVNIFLRKTLMISGTPFDERAILKKIFGNKTIKIVGRTLTVRLVAGDLTGFLLILLLLPLLHLFLVAHPECHEALHSHALGGQG